MVSATAPAQKRALNVLPEMPFPVALVILGVMAIYAAFSGRPSLESHR